jgi:hypothetical protein
MAGYDWQKDARASGLTAAQIATLRQQGFVVTGNTCRQSFIAYLDGDEQLFVTSDAIANTYSVLLEDSVRLLEATNARRLNTFLVEAWKEMPAIQKRFTGDTALLNPAFDRARMTMGIALELSTGEKVDAPPAIQKAIDDEAQRVIDAAGISKPAWLGPPDLGFEALDYTRFKPRGLYVGRPTLERYFRATAWLQAIPFRASKDEEMAAWLLLVQGLYDNQNKALSSAKEGIYDRSADSVKDALTMLVGNPDDADIFDNIQTNVPDGQWTAQGLAALRPDLAKIGAWGDPTKNGPRINDQIAVAGKDAKPEPTFRILSAYRLPDAAMFADTEQLHPGAFPGGREVAAALGSPTARQFYAAGDARLLAQIDQDKGAFAEGTLYNDYLNALATLFDPVDAAAPDLFRSSAWQEKSLQTFLGGWAQDRHVWLLQAKQNVEMMGMAEDVPSGFVEPVPDFFNRMAQLALKSHEIFSQAGAFDNEQAAAAQELRDGAAAYRRSIAASAKNHNAKPSTSDMEVMEVSQELLMLADYTGFMAASTDKDAPAELEKLADRLENPGTVLDPAMRRALKASGYGADEKWTRFVALCLKLEELANKQLHHRPLSAEDNQFYYEFGQTLASFMGYDSNEFNEVHDDAPRIADIYSDPQHGQVMEVGIGRPLLMYVLYPYEDKLILTHGAVLPYYEFSSADRLTDQSWADLLATPKAPAPPDWLSHVTAKPLPAGKSAPR